MKLTNFFSLLLIATFTLLFFPAIILSHPASDILITFNNETKTLDIEAVHSVKDAMKHFINQIKISVDGKVMIQQSLNSQSTIQSQKVSYKLIDAKAESKIEVETNCNKGGKLVKTWTKPKKNN